MPKSAPVAELGKLLWWVSEHEAWHVFKGGCAPWGPGSSCPYKCSVCKLRQPKPANYITPPCKTIFTLRVLHTASFTNCKCWWLLNCRAINSSSLVSVCCKLFAQQHAGGSGGPPQKLPAHPQACNGRNNPPTIVLHRCIQ